MDIDNEVEGQLAQLAHRMDCMGTEDEETLVQNFQQILAPHADLSGELCRFFLDMNNWNLQAALGSFYDYNAQQMALNFVLSMHFVADVTIGEGESVRPSSRFVKTWRVRNPGPKQWPTGCCLRHLDGDLLADTDHAEVEALETEKTTDISLTMTSPSSQGVFQSRWRMCTDVGLPFGDTIWCIIVVEDSGLLDLTQQFASTSCGSTEPSRQLSSHSETTNDGNAHDQSKRQIGVNRDGYNKACVRYDPQGTRDERWRACDTASGDTQQSRGFAFDLPAITRDDQVPVWQLQAQSSMGNYASNSLPLRVPSPECSSSAGAYSTIGATFQGRRSPVEEHSHSTLPTSSIGHMRSPMIWPPEDGEEAASEITSVMRSRHTNQTATAEDNRVQFAPQNSPNANDMEH